MKMISNIDELDLLSDLKNGDESAFAKLYWYYSPLLYANTVRLVKLPEIAEEVVQDLFQKVWERRQLIDRNKSFHAYLHTIAKNLVYDAFRKQKNQQKILCYLADQQGAHHYNHVDELLDSKELQKQIDAVIERLSPRRKMIYKLCKVEGKSYEEVGDMLGVSVSTVSDHIVKATKFIKQVYARDNFMIIVLMDMFF
ncbi:RNA polymerase sigma-70 factor [Sphingobacterium griseoflavum]|uniref:DNA-directed RNA polymerase sigma-70 factor n=1 Tax=Sphingobacterium griseoflavum TaxID=1474952 RepID=A0ABQ3HUG2_9SPHI|nr:RNA polymerase sigma-70 factor [Sphingobacterium griseoflavum]GHE23112.1 DNA-directed RNA polymerase sigma-70 factor [Sphingobacterium griseoflavum]